MRTTLLLLSLSLSLAGCDLRHHEREHDREAGELCWDHDDCVRPLLCVHARPPDGDHDRDDEGVCSPPATVTPTPTSPQPCTSTASVQPNGGSQPCSEPADGGGRD